MHTSVKLKLPVSTLINIQQAYGALSGRERAVEVDGPDGAKVTRIVIDKPNFKSGKTYLAIAKNIGRLNKVAVELEEARSAMVKQIAPEGAEQIEVKKNPDEFKKFIEGYQAARDAEQEIELLVLTEAEIDQGGGSFAMDVVALSLLIDHGLLVEKAE